MERLVVIDTQQPFKMILKLGNIGFIITRLI